jgi:hypothetical protein
LLYSMFHCDISMYIYYIWIGRALLYSEWGSFSNVFCKYFLQECCLIFFIFKKIVSSNSKSFKFSWSPT